MPTILESHKVFNELRNGNDFLSNPGIFTTTVKANVEEFIKVVTKFRIFWELIATPSNSDTLTVAAVAGGFSINSLNQDFEAKNFRPGDIFDSIDTPAAPTLYAGQIITLVSGSYMEFINTGAIPAGPYTDMEIKGIKALDNLTYQFNTPAASNSNNLVNDLFNFIQTYEFNGLIAAGGDITGVAKSPINWVSGSAVARQLATVNTYQQVYEVETTFKIPYFKEGEFDDLVEQTAVAPFDIESEFFKESIQLSVGDDSTTLRDFDITRPVNDSIGWYNKNFFGGERQYSLITVDLEELTSGDTRDKIEVTETTKVTIVMASNNTTFTTLDPLVVKTSYLPTESAARSDTGENFDTKWNYEALRGEIDVAPTSGTIINNFNINLDGPNQITITFELSWSVAQQNRMDKNNGNILLSMLMEDPALGPEVTNRLNLIVLADFFTKNNDIPGLVNITKDHIYYHKDKFIEGMSDGNTDLVAWNETLIMRDIEFELLTEVGFGPLIEEMSVLVVAYNPTTGDINVIQRVSIPTNTQAVSKSIAGTTIQNLNTDTTRGFLLPEDSQFNFLKVQTLDFNNPIQKYSMQIGVMINWQFWLENLNMNSVFYNALEPQNGLNKKTSNFSELKGYEIRLGIEHKIKKNNGIEDVLTTYLELTEKNKIFDFDLDKNVTPKYTTTVVYKDVNNVIIPKSAIKEELVTVTITWDDLTVKTEIEFEAQIKLEIKEQGTERSKHIISSIEGGLENSPLIPISGETLLKKSIVGGKYTGECLIDGAQLTGLDWSLSDEMMENIMIFSVKSMFFNGVDEWVDCGDNIELFPEKDDKITFSAWIKLNATGSIETIFANNEAANTRGITFIVDAAGKLKASIVSTSTSDEIIVETTSAEITDTNFHQVAFTYDGSETAAGVLIYVDIISVAVTTTQDTLTATIVPTVKEFGLGGNSNTGDLFHGHIDEVFFSSDRAWNPTDITEITVCPEDLSLHSKFRTIQSWWRMGEFDTISSITDQLTRTWSQLNGVDAYVNVANDASLQFSILDKFSISVWIRTTDGVASIIAKTSLASPNSGYTLRFNATHLFLELRESGSSWIQKRVTATNLHNTGEWTHILFTHDGVSSSAGQHIYVNNADQSMSTPVDNLTGDIISNSSLKIGDAFYGNLNGGIAHVAIFNDELSAADVDNIYMQGMNNPDYTGITGALTHLRMDTLDPVDEIGSNDGTSINMIAADIEDDISNGTPQNMDASNLRFLAPC